MAGTKLNLRTKVAASSLLEVVVSMVVIMVVLVLALTIFANVTRSSISAKQWRAQTIINDLQVKAQDTIALTTQELTINGWRVAQDVKDYAGSAALKEVHLTVFDEHNDKIAELRRLIISKH